MLDYVMGFQQPVAQDRLEAFLADELDINEIVVLMQDVIEAGLLMALPGQFHVAAQHCVTNGLCYCTGRGLQ